MNKQDYERLAQYMAFGADDDKPALIYTAARGLFAPADEPAEVSIRRLRGTAELPAQVAEHQRVLELERILEEALRTNAWKEVYTIATKKLGEHPAFDQIVDISRVMIKELHGLSEWGKITNADEKVADALEAAQERVLELERALTAAQQRIEALESERALAVRVAYELCPAETLNHLVFEDAATPYFVNSLVTYGDIMAVLRWVVQ